MDELRRNDCEVDAKEYWNALNIRKSTMIKKHKWCVPINNEILYTTY